MEGVVGPGIKMGGDEWDGEIIHLALSINQMTTLIYAGYVEVFEILHNGKVSQITGSNGTTVIQQEIPGGMKASNLNYLDGICTHGDSFTADIIHMPFFQKIAGVLVVGAEHTAAGILG